MARAYNQPRGERVKSAKLTESDVRLVRELAAERQRLLAEAEALTVDKIAEKFDVTRRTIERAVNGESWRHVR